MNEFKPKLFSVMKNYSGSQLVKDIVAGIIVAIIALPLSIALAIASGVGPEAGIYTAIVAGFIVSLLGGSRVQIAGPTAAFATIVAGIVMKDGREGLMIATIMAGIILIIMGIFPTLSQQALPQASQSPSSSARSKILQASHTRTAKSPSRQERK